MINIVQRTIRKGYDNSYEYSLMMARVMCRNKLEKQRVKKTSTAYAVGSTD